MKTRATGSRVIAGVATVGALAIATLGLAPGALSDSKTANDPDSPYPDITLTYLAGPLYQPNMLVPNYSTKKHKTWVLPATPATTQWGVYDNDVAPALTINSGDTVAVETLPGGGGQVVPGITEDQLLKINTDDGIRGPHTLTGPIYVNGAEPGDVVAIHINKIRTRSYATNNNSPTGGLFYESPELFPIQVNSYYLDTENMTAQILPNIKVNLKPFPGVLAVGRPDSDDFKCIDDSCNTVPPGNYGGNLDLNVMQVGTTTYLPVLVPGALIWTGDSHAKQGNGEIDLDALETAFPELNITITLIKDQPQVNWPLVETPDSWVTVGYALDLNVALDNLKTETVRFLMDSRKISQAAATKVMFDTWNCPITEVTDIVLGAHCIIPKSAKALRSPALPTSDTADYWVTTGSDPDIYKAMKEASLAALYKMSKAMKITIRQAYTLATMELDCRIERYHWGPDKNISCLVPKSIYTKPSVK